MVKLIEKQAFSNTLLSWFNLHGRQHLPWQINKTPYRVWVAEIMLQQTQVNTVIPYFQRFIQHFPDASDLARTTEEQVLHLWSGLGYYSRARNLHRAARLIQQQYHGNIPDNLVALQQLPGIGKSTAGAILACGFNKRAPILDGNVKRVLTLLYGIAEWPGKKSVENQLWQLADYHTPSQHIADYTQAIMDFGATLCIRSHPQCQQCPVNAICCAYQQGLTAQIPKKKVTNRLPMRTKTWLLLRYRQQLLLQKRPPTGIWGGLWCVPEIPEQATPAAIRQFCYQWHIDIHDLQFLPAFQRTFSHFHLNVFPVLITLSKKTIKCMEDQQQIWYNLRQPPALGIPAPVNSLLRSLL